MADDGSAFLADIDEATLKDLDQRLAMADCAPDKSGANGKYIPPQLQPHARTIHDRATAPKPETLLAGDDEGSAIDFLAELEQEVIARSQGGNTQGNIHAKAEQLHEALSRIFTFFNQISRHANKLEPVISRAYRLDAQTTYTGLRWHGAFTDSRKQDLSEKSHLSRVNFRVRLIANEPVTLTRRWDQLEALRKDLNILDLRAVDETVFNEKPDQEFLTLQLAPDFPVQMSFRGNYSAHRIDILCRNLEGFCISAFVLDVDHVNQSLLEELGRFLLSRNNTLPVMLRRVNHVPAMAKKT